MKRTYAILATFIVCVLYLTSCIDEEYDLNKDINTEITVGGAYLSLPIGTTDSIVLSELFDFDDDDEFFKALENGNYSISYKDSADIDNIEIEPVTIAGKTYGDGSYEFDPLPKVTNRYNKRGVFDTLKYAIPADKLSVDIKIDQKVPDEIEQLVSVEMAGESGVVLELSIDFVIPGNQVILKDFNIDFPETFVFDDKQSVFNDTLASSNQDDKFTLEKTFNLKSFNFGYDNKIKDSYFKLSDKIKITGNIIVPIDLDVEIGTKINIKITPKITLNKMTFSKVTGIFNPHVDPINDAFKFDGLPDFLQGDDVTLDFINPTIKFKVSNTLNIPMIADAEIIPMVKGVQKEGVDAKLNIKKAKDSGVPVLSEFWLAEVDGDMPSGWTYVKTDIGTLLQTIPDSLSINVGVAVDRSNNDYHTIDLTKKYDLKVNYEVDVPLALGADFKINYSDTIKDIGEDLEAVIDKITSLSLGLEATNSIPLNMSVRLIPVDKNFKEIEGLKKVEAVKISAGAGIGAEPKSTLSIQLAEEEAGALAKVYHFILDITADADNSTVAGMTLNADQYIHLKLSAKIEGGITIDLDE